MTPEVRSKVLAVYAAADAAVAAAGPRCDASGRCCRFTEYGHTLFISQFEAELLLEAAQPFARPASRDGCPFQVERLCTAREQRPLGCRVYFCDPAYEPRMVEITEDAIAKLKAVADAHGAGWHYAPLHHFLNAARPAGPPADSMTRHPLPVV
jgi:Fe-S-cluster containining protein